MDSQDNFSLKANFQEEQRVNMEYTAIMKSVKEFFLNILLFDKTPDAYENKLKLVQLVIFFLPLVKNKLN